MFIILEINLRNDFYILYTYIRKKKSKIYIIIFSL